MVMPAGYIRYSMRVRYAQLVLLWTGEYASFNLRYDVNAAVGYDWRVDLFLTRLCCSALFRATIFLLNHVG
jgi:hypothetical protein